MRSRKTTIHAATFFLAILLSAALTMATECWQYDGNQTACEGFSADCSWSPTEEDPWCEDATGCCLMKGCWNFDGDQSSCESDPSCNWQPNDKNQNPWCPNNVGCCDKKGCWNFINTNQSGCEGAFGGGLCWWANGSNTANPDPWCPEPTGCCGPKSCAELTNQTLCEKADSTLDMPCSWNNSTNQCTDGGFSSYTDADECINSGGWWDDDLQQCEMPTGESMFGGEVHCWFADNQPNICTNVTGCVYCTADKLTDPDSACYNNQEGWCQGHESFPGATDIAQDALACEDIKLKQVCNCGPLPNCKWNTSSTTQGDYCSGGVKTDDEKSSCQPPAQFCDSPNAKYNQTICNQLINTYFMPCQWNTNLTTPKCQFKSDTLFKEGPGDFNDIGSESSCYAAGGDWKTTTYTDPAGVVKTDSWCEMGFGNGFEQCDDSCWACEYQEDGSPWPDSASAQTACENSEQGFCNWVSDPYAFNGYGWCDFPSEFNFGGGDCNSKCKECTFSNDPQTACEASDAGCKWSNGVCMSLSKKTCDTDCFSCYDSGDCITSAAQCVWNTDPAYCKPMGFGSEDEICFDGIDNDNDGDTDCSDSSCGFDPFCGGNFLSGGMGGGDDCKMRGANQTYCEQGSTSMGNCTWVSAEWGEQFCDFPGSNCWMEDNNQTACQQTAGCEWINTTDLGEEAFCEVQETDCFMTNSTQCNATPGCRWIIDPYSPIDGFCDMAIFADCNQMDDQQSCNANPNCTWEYDDFSLEGGMCEPVCFGLDASSCTNDTYSSICTLEETLCEPEFSMADCPQYDHDETECLLHNATCFWTPDTQNPGSGWCDNIGMQMMFQGMDPSPPHHLGDDDQGDSAPDEVDMVFFGLKDDPDVFAFGIGVSSMADAAACNGYSVGSTLQPGPAPTEAGSGYNTTKFWWYLDTDGNSDGDCNATGVNGSYDDGFEFMMKYTARWQDGKLVEVRNFYKCASGTWALTNIPLSSNKKLMCSEIGGAMVALDKESLEGFTSDYNKSEPMRVFVASAGASNNRTSPSDSADEGWYTVGSADFKFECCECPGQDLDGDGFTSEMDPDCKFVKKFGFVPFEDCMDNKDNNGDGLVDCNDPQCVLTPTCGGTFNFQTDINDKKSPKVVFTKVDKFTNGAFIKFDSDEPANGTVQFYLTDSTCNNLNKTLIDVGDPDFAFDDYKPFHGIPLDNFPGNPKRLGYSLQNGTSYYYKLKLCDPSGNCAVSACSNFTTATTEKNFVFKMDIPAGYKLDIPNWGVTDDNMTYGKQANVTSSKDMNITVKCPDAGYKLTLVGADVLKAKELDFSDAFTCDATNDLIGMNSTKWQSMLYELHVDYVLITWAKTGDKVYHCDDDGSNCEDVTDYAECSTSGGVTSCKIPVTLGFSTYKISSTSSSSTSSGGGGGGGSSTSTEASLDLTSAGTKTTATLKRDQKFIISHELGTHKYKVESVTGGLVRIQSLETFETYYLFTSVPKGLDYNSDGRDDVKITLEGVTGGKALITFESVLEPERPTILPVGTNRKERQQADEPEQPQSPQPQPTPQQDEQAVQEKTPSQPTPIQGMAAAEQPGQELFDLDFLKSKDVAVAAALIAVLALCVASIWLPGRKKKQSKEE